MSRTQSETELFETPSSAAISLSAMPCSRSSPRRPLRLGELRADAEQAHRVAPGEAVESGERRRLDQGRIAGRLAEPTGDPVMIEAAAAAALDSFTRHDPVRLLGVRAEFADS